VIREGVIIALLLGRKPLFNWQHGSWRKKVGTNNASHFLVSPMLANATTEWGEVYDLKKIGSLLQLKSAAVSSKTIRTYQGGFSYKYFSTESFKRDLQVIATGAAAAPTTRLARYLQQHDSAAMQCLMPVLLRLDKRVTAPVDRDLARYRAQGRKIVALQIRVGDESFRGQPDQARKFGRLKAKYSADCLAKVMHEGGLLSSVFNISKEDRLAVVVSTDNVRAVMQTLKEQLRSLTLVQPGNGTSGEQTERTEQSSGLVFVGIQGAVQSLIFDGRTAKEGLARDSFLKVLRDWYAIGSADAAFVSRMSTFGETAWCSMGSSSIGAASALLMQSDTCEAHRCSLSIRTGSRGSTIARVTHKELVAAAGGAGGAGRA
jgi:hypothetical protein